MPRFNKQNFCGYGYRNGRNFGWSNIENTEETKESNYKNITETRPNGMARHKRFRNGQGVGIGGRCGMNGNMYGNK